MRRGELWEGRTESLLPLGQFHRSLPLNDIKYTLNMHDVFQVCLID
jgi:hypothetical protein